MSVSGKECACNKKQLISPSGTLCSADGEQNIIYNNPKSKGRGNVTNKSAKKKLPNPLRIDPTRTVTLRRSFLTHIRKQWGKLKGRIVKFLIDDDQFGLVRKQNLTKNKASRKDLHSLMLNNFDTMDWETRHKILVGPVLPPLPPPPPVTSNYNPQQPRDEHGRFAKDMSDAAIDESLKELHKINDEDTKSGIWWKSGKAKQSKDNKQLAKIHDEIAKLHETEGQKELADMHRSAAGVLRGKMHDTSVDWRPDSITPEDYMTHNEDLSVKNLVDAALKEFEHIWEEEYLTLKDFPKECNTKNFTKIITQYLAVNNEQMRDEKGRFASSGGGILDKVTGAAKKVGQRIVNSFNKFKDRYGAVGATAIVAAMLTPVPGIGFATIGVAEGIRAINKLVRSTNNNTVLNAGDFAFDSTEKQIQIFTKWLEQQIDELIDGATENELWDAYIQEGFKRGIARAWDDTKQATRDSTSKEKLDFYAGTREQFLRSTFHQAVSQERVRVLASRTFTDLENVTNDMATRIGRSLIDGLIQGDNPRDIAREIDDDLDIGRNRAETIARTEIIRSHASGQLDAMENMGVAELGVMVEWSTAGEDDPTVCPECAEMEGVVLTIDEARGMIPRHPNCRCAFIPANVGEDEKDQTRGKSAVDKAVDKSAELGDDDFSTAVPVTKDRPRSVVNMNPNHDEHGQFSSSGVGIKEIWQAYKDITDPQVKSFLGNELWNADIDPDGKCPKNIPDDAKLVRRLSSGYRDLQEKGNKNLDQADKVLEAHGMRKVDKEGTVTRFDGLQHEVGVGTGGGLFTGDKVKVTMSGWEKESKDGRIYRPLKAKVEKVK